MNGIFISTDGDVIFIAQDIGSYYRYYAEDDVLEYQPIVVGQNEQHLIMDLPPEEEAWAEVEYYIVGDEPIVWEGKDMVMKEAYQIIKDAITEQEDMNEASDRRAEMEDKADKKHEKLFGNKDYYEPK